MVPGVRSAAPPRAQHDPFQSLLGPDPAAPTLAVAPLFPGLGVPAPAAAAPAAPALWSQAAAPAAPALPAGSVAAALVTCEQQLRASGLLVSTAELEWGSLIGSGAFSKVYRARFRGVDVAVKLLDVHSPSPKLLADFQAEVALLAHVRHPNIGARALACGRSRCRTDPCPCRGPAAVMLMGACASPLYLVTEFCARGNLFDLLHSDMPLHWPLLLRMAVDEARALYCAFAGAWGCCDAAL